MANNLKFCEYQKEIEDGRAYGCEKTGKMCDLCLSEEENNEGENNELQKAM